MAVTAAAGIVAFAPQYQKGSLPLLTNPSDFYKMKATQVDLAVLDDTRLGDDEVGGRPVPTFPYKAGVMVGGGLTAQPRLENTLGWLLYALMGDVSSAVPSGAPVWQTTHAYILGDTVRPSVANNYFYECTTAGTSGGSAPTWPTTLGTTVNDGSVVWTCVLDEWEHTFKFDSQDAGNVKWLSWAKYMPKKDGGAATDLGEIYRDCKLVGSSFALTADRPLQTRLDILGRSFTLAHAADTWVFKNSNYEDYTSIPIGAHTSGSITLAGQELPIVSANLNFTNQPLDTQMERVYGDPFLEDVTIVKRQLTFDLLVKWNNPDLYAAILTGSTTGVNWTAKPYTGALSATMAVATPNVSTGLPFILKVDCPSAMLSMNGGITLAGGQAVMMRFSGVALDNAGEYTTFMLRNSTQSYTWPTS